MLLLLQFRFSKTSGLVCEFNSNSVMANLLSTKGNFPSTLSLNRRNFVPPQEKPVVKASAIYNSIFDIVGHTPLLKLNKPDLLLKDIDTQGKQTSIKCNILVKLEYLNPGGSIKDRIGKTLVDEAFKSGHLRNKWILEPSSGNTGIAIAMNSSVKGDGYHKGSCIVTKHKCSEEKICVMKLLGAQIVLLKNSDSEIGEVDKALSQHPDKVLVVDQFDNQVNPQTHYSQTAVEIYDALGHKWPDMIVMGTGSGGTFTGIATRIKNEGANCRIVHADPEGSRLHPNAHPHPFLVEGLVGSEIPLNLDISLRDEYQAVTDKEAFLTAKNLAKHEGILCGGSSGLAVAAAIKAIIKDDNINANGKNVVVILPDGIRNYMTKFVQDEWMEAHMFQPIPALNVPWYNHVISGNLSDPFIRVLSEKVLKFLSSTIGDEAFPHLAKPDHDVAAIVLDENGPLHRDWDYPMVGLMSSNSLRYHLTNPTQLPVALPITFESLGIPPGQQPVTNYMERDVYVLKIPAPNAREDGPKVGLVSRMLDITQYVVLGYEDMVDGKPYFYGRYIVQASDILRFMGHIQMPQDTFIQTNFKK